MVLKLNVLVVDILLVLLYHLIVAVHIVMMVNGHHLQDKVVYVLTIVVLDTIALLEVNQHALLVDILLIM